MRKATKKKKAGKAQIIIVLLLFVASIIILPSVINNSVRGLSYGASNTTSGIQFIPQGAHNGLQLQWFLLPTTAPSGSSVPTAPTVPSAPTANVTLATPTSTTTTFPGYAPLGSPECGFIDDNGVQVQNTCQCIDLEVDCVNGKPFTPTGGSFSIPSGDLPLNFSPGENPCGTAIAPGNGLYCVAKPVIYLYPTTLEKVNVDVQTSGAIVVSDPHYPDGGWKNVLAQPNGELTYDDKQYSELFYESSVNDFTKPDAGIVIPKAQLKEKLNLLLTQLGLIGSEKQEFIAYWLPRLQQLNSPYVFFSVIDNSAKANVDNVIISPKPDTEISFIAYFKPVQTSDNTNVLQLPPTPKRVGFTSVEWGGIIDK